MEKVKELNLSMDKLMGIAEALNENIIANRSRDKENKITTDMFIKKFGITRKDFSACIKDTEIRYNRSTFLYDVPGKDIKKYNGELKDSLHKTNEDNKCETKVSLEETTENINSETLVAKSETYENGVNEPNNKGETKVSLNENVLMKFDHRLRNIEDFKIEIEEMLSWYQEQKKKENIIEIEMPEIKINREMLNEDAITRGFKVYPGIVAQFKEFCKSNSQYTMQDLMAMALIEYMGKYKK